MMMPFNKGLRLRLVEHKVFSYSSDDGQQLVSGNMILLLLIKEVMILLLKKWCFFLGSKAASLSHQYSLS
jgi:hypothetical protein